MSLNTALLQQYAPDLLSGLRLTIEIWLAGSVIALVVGATLGIPLTFARPGLRAVVRCYVEFFRGTPLLVQLFLLYYGGPRIGLTLNAMTAGLIGLGLYGGAYFAELFRAGFSSIPAGQLEAARSFGYSRRDAIRHIILPQALILMLPPSVNLLVIILKDTAILSILTIPELTFQVTGMTLETFAFVEPYLALALGYWLLVELTARLGHAAEHRLTRHMARA
ncbi:MAG TPA: amino acid ABC transporter permease [Acetobacteraceae bacterium]|nr:amino acid ABC transporter permease [Acetobacteraceae bacterium]